jgi:uncharacterized membrane protein
MKLDNPLEMNDWKIRNFLLFSFSWLALLWIMFALKSVGRGVPLLQQVAGCVCLLFIPGLAVLRILRLHKLGSVETTLYAIGMSISVVIFAGLTLNIVGPAVGLSDPLSALHLVLFMSGVILAFCVASYWRDKDYAAPSHLHVKAVSPLTLGLLLLPFLSIYGAYLVNTYEISALIMLLIVCVGAVVLILGWRKEVDDSTYALAIFVISLSLLLYNALISRYLWGWDVFGEANVVNFVINNAIWNPTYAAGYNTFQSGIVAGYNAVLSISILAPAVSQIGNIDIASLFKIVYPALFSLVPVALYRLFRKQTSEKAAFLGSFYFVVVPTFFTEMVAIARQEIAELFLVLFLLVLFSKKFSMTTRACLLILFAGTMIVSHYGIAYLFMIQLIVVYVLLVVADKGPIDFVRRKRDGGPPAFTSSASARSSSTNIRKDRAITATLVIIFAAMALAWYSYTAKALTLSYLAQTIVNSIPTNVVPSTIAQASAKLESSPTLLASFTSSLNTVASLFIFLGVVAAVVHRRRMGVDREYLAFAVSSGLLALLIVALPVLQTTWNVSRLHHLTLIILAPFCVLGIMALFRLPGLIKKTDKTSYPHERKAYVVASVFLVLLLLFNTGFMSALAREPMLSPSLFHEDLPLFVHGGDLAGAKWLGTASRQDSVYADYYSLSILLAYSNTSIEKIQSLTPKTKITTESEIFVRAGDVALIESGGKNEQLLGPSGGILSSSFTGNLSKIYDSGSVIYSD